MGFPRITTVLYFALACLALVSFVDARAARRSFRKRATATNPVPIDQSGYTVPLSNGSATFPGPPAGANLVAVGIGRGVEYYTCDNSSATPEHAGGQADIYDANEIIQYLPNENYLHDLVKYFYNYDYGLLENSSLTPLGKTYSSPAPVFDLGDKGYFEGSIDYSVQSPLANSWIRAIDWAQLSSTTATSTLHNVFRVETYGGGGPCNCVGQPQTSIWQYACEYWFYV